MASSSIPFGPFPSGASEEEIISIQVMHTVFRWFIESGYNDTPDELIRFKKKYSTRIVAEANKYSGDFQTVNKALKLLDESVLNMRFPKEEGTEPRLDFKSWVDY